MTWQSAQTWESNWWGDCLNTYQEETKQQVYAAKMGLAAFSFYGKHPVYDLQNKSVVDIGGGPTSLLLKCINRGASIVIDPCHFPGWVAGRYRENDIVYVRDKGENLTKLNWGPVGEVWIYNVLQHVDSPGKIIKNARAMAKTIRIFEWLEIPKDPGHIHVLTKAKMDKWLGGEGKAEHINDRGAKGLAYYGVFKGVK